MGTVRGWMDWGPCRLILPKAASRVSMPPMPLPRMTPIRSGSTLPAARPASAMASIAATIAYCVNRSMRRGVLGAEDLVGGEVLHLARDLRGVLRGVEPGELPDPVLAVLHRLPEVLHVVAQGIHGPHARHDHAPRHCASLPSTFLDRHAPVDAQHVAGDVGRHVRGEEGDDLRDLLRRAGRASSRPASGRPPAPARAGRGSCPCRCSPAPRRSRARRGRRPPWRGCGSDRSGPPWRRHSWPGPRCRPLPRWRPC